ncbi:SemiSWEET family transporter [Bradyrhizobium sp. U531]|uniref:SemiSWEET family sugar transporter n=1 Tax=Bradyrhizobium sp. U531 TaxID=3053458 RepID=UPI003F42E998
MSALAPYIGGIAAFLASLSYVPQVRKAWPRGSTADLSLGMLASLTLGLALWIVYGLIQEDWVIVGSNLVGATLAGIVLGCKVRDLSPARERRPSPSAVPIFRGKSDVERG